MERKNKTLLFCQIVMAFAFIILTSGLAEENAKINICEFEQNKFTLGAVCYTGNYELQEGIMYFEYFECTDHGWETKKKEGLPGQRTLCQGGIQYVGGEEGEK